MKRHAAKNPLKKPPLDKDGYLKKMSDWNPEIAHWLAQNEDIDLSENHWEIISLLREFYDKYEHSPAMRALVSQVKRELGPEKGNSLYLLKLFPGSPAKLASKIAGLPRPSNCL